MTTPHDPGTDPEAEGIPDVQDGTPEQYWMNDPQQLPVPGDQPTVGSIGRNTPREMQERGSLDERLAEEEPDGGRPVTGAPEEEPAGRLYDAPDPAGPRDQDVYSQQGDDRALSAEEEAVRVVDDDRVLEDDRVVGDGGRP